MRVSFRLLTLLTLLLGLLSGTTLAVSAAHESNNRLAFAPVASLSPDATGSGVINYIKGTSGEEPDTQWSSSFRFTGLMPNTAYTVVIKGRFSDATAFSAICSFTTNAAGMGGCAERFTGLRRLGVAQLRLGDVNGTAILQATRQAVATGPGEIVSRGGCREADSAGAICNAPGK